VLNGVEQIGEWLDAVGTAHSMSSLRRVKGNTVSSFKRNPIMESKLTICVKAGIGGDLHHLSDMPDIYELRGLFKHISILLSK
jgi:hypothetical protein